MSEHALLLIDDDREFTSLLTEYLQPQGYHITVANDGETGLALATGQTKFDLILLDVMMPKMDGYEVLKRLRVSRLTPVLMLTAKGDDFDRIFGLEMGADDYLPKPFNHRELSARVKAIIRRMEYMPTTHKQQQISIDEINLSPGKQEVLCAGHKLEFTATEFAILHLLMSNAGQLVSKEHISQNVLGRKLAAFDRSIDMHVSNIRKKIAKFVESDRIKTIRGAGYMFLVSD